MTPFGNAVVEVFHDGSCPLCMREIAWLQRLDRHARIRFTDIAAIRGSVVDTR